MKTIQNELVKVVLDERWPRAAYFEAADGTRIQGEPLAVEPRLYLFRKSDHATLTSDCPEVATAYALTTDGSAATYHDSVTVDGEPACEFDVTMVLDKADLVFTIGEVKEFGQYRFFSIRMRHVISADSTDTDSLAISPYLQGRLLDPAKCSKPCLIDYSWHGSMARLSGVVWRPTFMATIDLPGYEDLILTEVWSYSRITAGRTLASLGAELMYRQRSVESAEKQLVLDPVPAKNKKVRPLDEPILCADSKEFRLHFIAARKGKPLTWADAARYLQTLVPKAWRPDKRYDNTLVYKICPTGYRQPFLTFEQAADIVRKVCNLTDGMKQVCYMPFFQYEGGDSGHPLMTPIYPPVGDKKMLLRAMKGAEKYNCILSFHDNLDQADIRAPWFDPDSISRDGLGRFFSGGYWGGVQLVQVSMPRYLPQLKKLVAKVVKEYGIHTTYHLDTHSGDTFRYDASPDRPFNATAFVNARIKLAEEFDKYGVNLTSECLVHPYLAYLGHVWALFNRGKIWEGELPVPFFNFVYHGVASWNASRSPDQHVAELNEKQINECLIQGGGAGIEFPESGKRMNDVMDLLFLVQPVYAALRQRKWTDFKQAGAIRRVEYGKGSYIEVDDDKMTYKAAVDGKVIGQDYATVFAGPKKGTFLAFSRTDRELTWPAPAGLKNGPVKTVELTEIGPGLRGQGVVKNGKLKLTLKAHVPLRISQ